MNINRQGFIDIDDIKEGNPDDKKSIYSFKLKAVNYISNMKWCNKIQSGHLALGLDGVLAVFFFNISPSEKNIDDYLWVIVGDIPPAYLVPDHADDAISALEIYVEEMSLWVDAVRKGSDISEVIPVNVPPTKENAQMLESRLNFILKKVIPEFS